MSIHRSLTPRPPEAEQNPNNQQPLAVHPKSSSINTQSIVQYINAKHQFRIGNVPNALDCLSAAILLKNGNPKFHRLVIRCHLATHDYTLGILNATNSLVFFPLDTLLLLLRAECYLKVGNKADAIQDIEFVLELDPTNTKALTMQSENP